MSSKLPKLLLGCVRSTAKTYEMFVAEQLGGWAICTVNDATGELLITSDWGNWNYQWSSNPKHLGAPNFTAFLSDRSSVHYLADKLGGGRNEAKDFDAEATAKKLCGYVAKKRLADGREAIGLADDNEETVAESTRRLDMGQGKRNRFFTKAAARGLVEDIESVAHDFYSSRGDADAAGQMFLERFYRVLDQHEAHELFSDTWDDLVFEQSHRDKVLREAILPTLIEACRQTTLCRVLVAANGPQPAPEYA